MSRPDLLRVLAWRAALEPGIEAPVGTESAAGARRRTFYGIMHADEYAGAMEALLFDGRRFALMPRFKELSARVMEFLGRVEGAPGERPS